MEKTNLENLNKLAKLFGTDRLISPEEIQEIRGVLVGVLANNKKELESLTAETRELVNKVLNKVLDEHDTYLEKSKQIVQEAKSDTTEAIQATMKSLEEVKKLCKEVMDCKPENGKDADEEYVIGEVLNRIKLPEYKEVVLDDGGAIVDKINALPVNEENQIDAKHIKNLPEVKGRVSGGGVSRKVVEQMIAASGAAGIDLEVEGTPNVDQGKLNLLGGTNMTITDNGDGSVTFDATGGGSGSPGGSNTQVQFNDSGAFGGDAGLTYNKTTDTLTVGGGLVVDTSTLAVDATNNRVGIGTASPGFTLHAVGSTSGGFAQLERTTSATTNLAGVAILKATSSGDMADTFGTQLAFNIEDTAAVSNQIALIAASRAGADNTGNLDFYTANAGTVTSKLKVSSTGVVSPATSDASSLGSTSLQWSDLFLAEGGVINFDNGDVTLTQTGNTLNLAGGNLVLTDQTASQVAILDASKHLIGADTATYPSLTELSYVKGVTSAIQTQLNAKGTGSVTSVDVSGGTTGLTFTGGPITTSGTITAAGTLAVANGGTGQTTYTNGQLLIGNTTGNTLTKATLTGTSNQVVVTNGGGSITLSTPQDIATTSNPQFATIELGAASDTTLSRSAAGVLAVEGVVIPSISSTNTLSNKTIRNTVEPGTDDTYTGEDITGFNATATIAQWEAVYLSTTGWALTDADAASTAGGVMVGLAAAAGTNGNPLTVVTRGVIRNDGWTWTTVGAPLYLSTTAGAITETAPSGTDDVVRIVGYVMSDDCIFLNPSNDWITRV